MRPTVAEQLRETRRILGDLLLPQLDDDYSVQILTLALANLEMLETVWTLVLPFLHRDNDAALALLEAVRGEVDADLAAAIDGLVLTSAADPFDASAVNERSERIQALVVRAIVCCEPDGRRRIQAYLLERTARYPMRPRIGASSRTAPTKET